MHVARVVHPQVGIHDDDTVNRLQGGGFPVLNLNERTLRWVCDRCNQPYMTIFAKWIFASDR